MNCREIEGLIALHAGGDLNPEEAAAVEQHLDGCDACRALAAELRDCQTVLNELGAEVPGEAVYGSLLARLSAASALQRRWTWALAAAAAVLLGLAGSVWQYAERQRPGATHLEIARATLPVPRAPEVKKAVTMPAATSDRPKTRVRRARARKPEFRQDAEPLVMKLLTDDPNVVIYWIVEGTGE